MHSSQAQMSTSWSFRFSLAMWFTFLRIDCYSGHGGAWLREFERKESERVE